MKRVLIVVMAICLISLVNAYAPSVDDSMQVYYKFNDNLNDDSIHLNTAIGDYVSFNDSIVDYSIILNTSSNLSSGSNLNANMNSYSYSLLVKLGSYPTAGNLYSLLSMYDDPYMNRIQVDENGLLGENWFGGWNSAGVNLSLNKWHLITVVFNGVNADVYVNNTYYGSVPATGSSNYNKKVYIGNTNLNFDNLNGSVDEVIVWNKTLTAKERQNIYTHYGFCTTPTEDYQVYGDTTLCTGTYNLKDANNNGVLNLSNDNIILDCNGSLLVGNYTNETDFYTFAIENRRSNNIVKNCNIRNYFTGIDTNGNTNTTYFNNIINNSRLGVALTNSNISNISGNYFVNDTVAGIYSEIYESNNVHIYNNYFSNIDNYQISSSGYSNNWIIENNSHLSCIMGGISLIGNNHAIVRNNLINKTKAGAYPIFTTNVYNLSIYNNNFTNAGDYLDLLYSSRGLINVSNNNFYNCSWSCIGVWASLPNVSNKITIQNNSFNDTSQAIHLGNYTNVEILDNRIDDVTNIFDGYEVGILALDGTNVTIARNNLTRIGCIGILSQKGLNVNILNNSIDYDFSWALSKGVECEREIQAGIGIQELYKTYTGDSSELESDNLNNKVRFYNNTNVNILGNIITNWNVLLRSQGTVNLINDLTNYWYRSFQAPTYLVNKDELYISNDFNNISNINYSSNPTGINYKLGQGWLASLGGRTNFQVEYSFFKDYIYFKNLNNSKREIVYYPNSSVNIYNSQITNPSIISNSQLNVSLNANNTIYIR